MKLPRSRPLTQPTGACRRAQASSRKARAKDGRPGFVQSPKAGPKDVRAGPARPVSNTAAIRRLKSIYATHSVAIWKGRTVCTDSMVLREKRWRKTRQIYREPQVLRICWCHPFPLAPCHWGIQHARQRSIGARIVAIRWSPASHVLLLARCTNFAILHDDSCLRRW